MITIHDSIVTTVGNEDYVKRVMEEELVKIVGVAPEIDLEPWFNKERDISKTINEASYESNILKVA